jgi:hypothetical protein
MTQHCTRCHATHRRLVLAYWGDPLCPNCVIDVVEFLDRTEAWPTVEIPDNVAKLEQDR